MFRYAFLTLAVAGMVSGFLSIACPEWATKTGLDLWNLPDLERSIIAQRELSEKLERDDQIILQRIAAKEQVIRDLLAERLTLREAAAWFRRLNTEPPECPAIVPYDVVGRTEGERYCRQVLQWVRVETSRWTPSHAEEVTCRLAAELESYLTSYDGVVELPDV